MSDLAEICNFFFYYYLQKERRYQKYGVSEAYLKMVTLLKMRAKLTLPTSAITSSIPDFKLTRQQ